MELGGGGRVVWCGVVWCGVVWCGVVWCGVVWCGVVWCGVVWCGVVWCGVVWCGVVWCGVVWCGPKLQWSSASMLPLNRSLLFLFSSRGLLSSLSKDDCFLLSPLVELARTCLTISRT